MVDSRRLAYQAKPSRARVVLAPFGLLVVLVMGGVACTPSTPPAPVEFRVPVLAREVATGDVEDGIIATGTLRAAETITLTADTAGTLLIARNTAGQRLGEGDRVEAGQIIADITGEDVRLAARTEATFQRYEQARIDHASAERLHENGLISEQEYRQVETTLADAKLEWERSRLTESRSRLTTPIAGVLLRLARDEQDRPLADGQLVAQGFAVAQIAPTVELIADVDLVGPDVARVRAGLPARVRHHAWESKSFAGKVLRLAPTLDPTTRSLRAEIVVSNRDGLLRPGMFVEVTMVAEARSDVLVVPREAVTEREGRRVIFVVKGQRVSRRDVVLGLGDDEIVEVRQGVEPGERIVVRGLETLTDNQRVRVSGG